MAGRIDTCPKNPVDIARQNLWRQNSEVIMYTEDFLS